jgi:hypothetical protein
MRRTRRAVSLGIVLATLWIAGCGGGGGTNSGVDPTPERKDGTPSHEFEQEDLDAAASASDAVKEYCSGAVSEAQRVGCESHVTESDIP